ncbi:MAG: type I methionyl aminopeptidase [Candidatus Gottesmanbacteria bacterium]
MTSVKTPEEIHSMRVGGKKLGRILKELLAMSIPGIRLLDLEEKAQQRIKEEGGLPSFSTVADYQWATCLCINDVVVHGIPSEYRLQHGDVFTIDIGMIYEGLHTDTAWTKIIGTEEDEEKEKQRFLDVGVNTLWKTIAVARPGNRIGHISEVIQREIEGAGYSVIKDLTGHGVGKKLHEEPIIPEFVKGDISRTPLLTAGMTLAIEIIYAAGKGSIEYQNDDGWALASKDRSLTATFEHTIAIGVQETDVLTKSDI